jgi:ElaA protein
MSGLSITRTTDLAAPLAIRRAVFVDEQAVPETDEVDGLDPECLHWLACDATGPVATLRVRILEDAAKIQRVAVLARARGTGSGAALMRRVMEDLREMGVDRTILGAQIDAIGFYERLGFVAHGPVYEDAGIPHRHMSRDL